MALDPYKPPAAHVADLREDEALAGRPPQVVLACRILWLALFLGLVMMHPAIRGDWDWLADDEDGSPGDLMYIVFALAGGFALAYGVLTYLIGRRNDFARWIMLAVLALGWLLTLGDLVSPSEDEPPALLADLVLMAAELWACYLLFLSPAAAWFRR